MKKIFFLILILVCELSFACKCSRIPMFDRVHNSDFVATAKILDVKPDEKNEAVSNLKIEITELFKGESITSLNVYSSINTSCSLYIQKDTTWLIYANKGEDNKLIFGYCSGSRQMDRKLNSEKYPYADSSYKRSIELDIQILQFLKSDNIIPENEFELNVSIDNNCLDKLKGLNIEDERFSLYELEVSKDLSIDYVTVLKKFGDNKIDLEIEKCIKENLRLYHRYYKDYQIDCRSNIIIAIYHYEAERGNKSFFSAYKI